jgi:hypothetical protein
VLPLLNEYESDAGHFQILWQCGSSSLLRLVGIQGLVVSNRDERPRYIQIRTTSISPLERRNLGNGGEAGGSCRQNRDGVGG